MISLPQNAQIIIVGGGIAGISTAYHLAKLGCKDVLVLEQGKLTSGTTWHAAGLIGQMRPNRNMTRMSRYGIELYSQLEKETGLATGWKQCGSVNVAKTPERMQTFYKQAAMARSFGVDVEIIDPKRIAELYPVIRSDDLQGGLWIPGDGKANPADLTMSLAKGARALGVKIIEGIEVTGVLRRESTALGSSVPRVVGIQTSQGEIHCETLVNCAGQWARQFGKLAGVSAPLYSAEHFYIVTDRIDGVHPMLPVMRDPDGFIYYKEEVGGLLMGGFEPQAKPWKVDPIPANFQFQLLDEDWDQFEILMNNAIHRTPCLATAKVKMLLNGPESFTPDGNFILGQAPELANYFVCAGFNSAGIANSGGAGQLIAQWIVGKEAPSDLWDVDIRRFGPFMANRRALSQRTGETLGLHYAMRWPRQELETTRPLRTSPLYDLLREQGAEFGSKNGWERANYFRLQGVDRPAYGLGPPGWLPFMQEEQLATRQAVAVYDQSSFSKLLLQGRDALSLLNRLCANEIDIAIDHMVYTPMLNARGGFESDLTIIRQARDQFLIVTGSAQATRDADWITSQMRVDEFAVLTDVSAQYCVLSVMGPSASKLLNTLSPDDISAKALPFSGTKIIDLGLARVRAARMSYVGGPGFELYVPVEMTRHVYLELQREGQAFGLRNAGYYCLDALRIEMGRRAWGAELGPDENPFEAGMTAWVKFDKPSDFTGKSALLALKGSPLKKKLVTILFQDAGAYAWGGETIYHAQQAVGELSSVGWSPKAAACLALGYVRGETANQAHQGTPAEIELWGKRVAVTLFDAWR